MIIFLQQNQRDALIPQTYFWNRTLHVSDNFSVHLQDSSTLYAAIDICHRGYADCLLAGSGCSILIPLASSQLRSELFWGYYAVYIGNSLRTYRDYLSFPTSRVKKSKNKAVNAMLRSVPRLIIAFHSILLFFMTKL